MQSRPQYLRFLSAAATLRMSSGASQRSSGWVAVQCLEIALGRADLDAVSTLGEEHVATALRYRAHATSPRYSEEVVEV